MIANRTRSAAALFAGVAASSMGYTIVVAVLPLAAEDLVGSATWSGLPSSVATTGVAAGTAWLAVLTVRRGRRRALAAGYWSAAVAAVAAAFAAAAGRFVALIPAVFVLGAGYAANRLSRYAAADLYEPAKRSRAIGWNVWAATVGSVAGPLLLSTTERAGSSVGIPGAMGPFLVAGVSLAAAGLVVHATDGAPGPVASVGPVVASPTAASLAGLRLAVASLVTSQVVMILIMTMTPVHIRHGGHGLDAVGVVFAAHTFGMFALAPVAGLLSDRFGRVPMIVAASVTLAISGVLAAASAAGSALHAVALLLLGLGWCFSFVAASALLTESATRARLVRTQGYADSLAWGSAAAAGLGSGFLLAAVGYGTLSHVAAALALVPLLFLRRGLTRPLLVPPASPDAVS